MCVVGNEDEGNISNGPSPSANESSWIDKMFMERKSICKIEHAKCQMSVRDNHICKAWKKSPIN